jgi:hypothetical protein
MSLIEEALRRVQDPTISQVQKTQKATAQAKTSMQDPTVHSWPTTPPPPLGGPTASAPSTQALFAVALVIIALTAGLIIGGGWWMRRAARTPSTSLPPSPVASSLVTTAPLAEVSPPASRTPPPASRISAPPAADSRSLFVLSGVVEGVGESYAVINGMVVRAGDGIEGATVLRIGDGSVTLRRPDGTNLVLRVSP